MCVHYKECVCVPESNTAQASVACLLLMSTSASRDSSFLITLFGLGSLLSSSSHRLSVLTCIITLPWVGARHEARLDHLQQAVSARRRGRVRVTHVGNGGDSSSAITS